MRRARRWRRRVRLPGGRWCRSWRRAYARAALSRPVARAARAAARRASRPPHRPTPIARTYSRTLPCSATGPSSSCVHRLGQRGEERRRGLGPPLRQLGVRRAPPSRACAPCRGRQRVVGRRRTAAARRARRAPSRPGCRCGPCRRRSGTPPGSAPGAASCSIAAANRGPPVGQHLRGTPTRRNSSSDVEAGRRRRRSRSCRSPGGGRTRPGTCSAGSVPVLAPARPACAGRRRCAGRARASPRRRPGSAGAGRRRGTAAPRAMTRRAVDVPCGRVAAEVAEVVHRFERDAADRGSATRSSTVDGSGWSMPLDGTEAALSRQVGGRVNGR